jgi:methyl-accepting chemotaxis protein
LFDIDETSEGPSPETRAAVLRIAATIRAEADALDTLSARARKEAEHLLHEHARAATQAVAFFGNRRDAQAEGRSEFPEWSEHFAAVNDFVLEIATTALSAALSGVRAGASTRGFGEAAKGIDELERALRSAWEDLDELIVELEDRAAETAAKAAVLRTAGKDVARNTSGLPRSSVGDDEAASAISRQLDTLKQLTERIAKAGEDVATACDEMGHLVRSLAERLAIAVRETPIGNRRATERFAYETPCIISTSDKSYSGKSLDLSATGALVKVRQQTHLQRGQPITLHLQNVAPIIGTVAATSPQGVHVSFDLGHGANAEAKPAFTRMLDLLVMRSQSLVDRSTHLARRIRTALEEGIQQNRVSLDDLLSTDYTQEEPSGEDGDAPRFGHPALAFYEEALTPILEAVHEDAIGIAHAAAMDRSGYVAGHAPSPASRRSGRARLRQRRLFTDWLNQRAARNLRPFLIQVMPRDEAEAETGGTIRSVSVPIFVGGRHWGCAEIAYALEDGDAALSPAED